MKKWYELFIWGLLGKHKRLLNPTPEMFAAFCRDQQRSGRIIALTIVGNTRGYGVDFSLLRTCRSLNELYIEDAVSQAQLEQIATCTQLTVLDVQHAGKLESLAPLAALTGLRALAVTLFRLDGAVRQKSFLTLRR